MTTHSTRRTLLGMLGVGGVSLGAAACGSSDPFEEDQEDGQQEGGGSGDGSDGGGEGGSLVVGSQAYYSNEIIAELLAQALEAEGYTVDRQYQIGQREVYMPELENGSLDVLPEYLGNLLQHYDAEAATAGADELHGALGETLPEGLRVLDYAEATDQDSYTTTSDFAEQHSLSAIGDLSGVDEDLQIAANSEFEVRPYGPEGALEVYGVEVSVVPVEDSGGPLTVQALTDGDVQLANIYTADPAIAANDLVVLEDPESLILPQNVVPVVTETVDESAEAAMTAVIEQLTADDLVELNRRSTEDQMSSADIASEWLSEKGLV